MQSRFGKSGAARKLGLVQIVEEASAIRGVSQTLGRLCLLLAGAVAAFRWDYGEGLSIRPHGIKIAFIIARKEIM